MIDIKEASHVTALNKYKNVQNGLVVQVSKLLPHIVPNNLVQVGFLFSASFPCCLISDMHSSRLQKFIWNGPISENVSLRVISDVAKFHAFIIKLNNSVFFWSITAGLIVNIPIQTHIFAVTAIAQYDPRSQSRPQSPLFFWSAPRTRTSGQIGFRVRKSRTSGYTAQNQQ